ncbi:unnamed protein product [Nyctereutes procyonoides]|uniref:(raccoon dog) hypothetical protein n=1 Tax=Nyctereutes procyonoides TaxID=34880 RepID=A0A811YGF5_NYCPR|nr:unnamed protein product [Nyctereutes procyonoides]
MVASRRLKELEEIRKYGRKNFCNIQPGLIVPDNPPCDKGAFRIEINFPAEYPFKPPKITFKTNITRTSMKRDRSPATKTNQVIQSLIALVNNPQPEHPLRSDLAEEYS